jgi:hypothetical protein
MTRDCDVGRFDQRKACCERERLRRWVTGSKLNKRASVEIARNGNPGPTLTPPACLLVEGHEPIAFHTICIGNQIGVGRTGLLDDADAGQKRLPAARSVSVPSESMSR